MGCAEFCLTFGWSAEKYRKVAQRGRARLRASHVRSMSALSRAPGGRRNRARGIDPVTNSPPHRSRPSGRRRSIERTTARRRPSARRRSGHGDLPSPGTGRPRARTMGRLMMLLSRAPREVYRVFDEEDFLATRMPALRSRRRRRSRRSAPRRLSCARRPGRRVARSVAAAMAGGGALAPPEFSLRPRDRARFGRSEAQALNARRPCFPGARWAARPRRPDRPGTRSRRPGPRRRTLRRRGHRDLAGGSRARRECSPPTRRARARPASRRWRPPAAGSWCHESSASSAEERAMSRSAAQPRRTDHVATAMADPSNEGTGALSAVRSLGGRSRCKCALRDLPAAARRPARGVARTG